jgi:hypothetical protein
MNSNSGEDIFHWFDQFLESFNLANISNVMMSLALIVITWTFEHLSYVIRYIFSPRRSCGMSLQSGKSPAMKNLQKIMEYIQEGECAKIKILK